MKFARQTLAVGYEHSERLSEQTIHTYLEPLFGTPERTRLFEQWFKVNGDTKQTVMLEPALRQLHTPTLIVWGTAKLFFPEERPDEFARPLRDHWMLAEIA